MKSTLLLPNRYKKIGWFLLIPASVAGLILIMSDFELLNIQTKMFSIFKEPILSNNVYFGFTQENITPTLTGILFITGALMIGFSREKDEDEFISGLRLSSLLWAVLVNYILLLFAFLFIYGLSFLNVMLYNMFTVLIIFIARFHYLLYRSAKITTDEE